MGNKEETCHVGNREETCHVGQEETCQVGQKFEKNIEDERPDRQSYVFEVEIAQVCCVFCVSVISHRAKFCWFVSK